MNEFKIYSVSDKYIDFLRKKHPHVYSNKYGNRTHTRKYIGIAFTIGEFCYYIPMSSPKESDYKRVGEEKVIRKSIVPIIRIVIENNEGIKELKGTLRISNMIPVPKEELELYDLENEDDALYKDLVQSEIIFIRRNKNKIKNFAKVIYKQKIENDSSANYINSALDYKALEESCMEFERIGRMINEN